MPKIIVDASPSPRGLDIRYADTGEVVENVFDLREVEGRALHMLIACDPRMRGPENGLRGGMPLEPPDGPEMVDEVCAWWFAFADYEVRGGELYPDHNTRDDWTRESGWDRLAKNSSSGTYGIPQVPAGGKG